VRLRVADDQKRADKYARDLNKARDEITKAQEEMKSIDTEVTNFHQKMARSMHALLEAFDEGFQAMDKAKKDEASDVQIDTESEELNTKRVKKLDKIHSSISNLEALTSKLKLSFNDEPEKPA
jgi:chromosome segregation ATPase